MILLYKGHRGCGKTLSMVKDGFKFFQKGYSILRNFECSFGKYISEEEILNLDKYSDIQNCVIMMDEVQIFFDSRRSMRSQNLTFSNFIQQIRKRNIILLCTTQYSNTIDLRLRQHIDVIAYPMFLKQYNVCEITYIDLTTLEDDLFGKIREPKSIRVVFNAIPVYKIYNTNEMIV